jgi:hypothetical protein
VWVLHGLFGLYKVVPWVSQPFRISETWPWKEQSASSQEGHKCHSIKNKENMVNVLGPMVTVCHIYNLNPYEPEEVM